LLLTSVHRKDYTNKKVKTGRLLRVKLYPIHVIMRPMKEPLLLPPAPKEIEQFEILSSFAQRLLNNTVELDADIAAALSKNFWKLYEPI
jgi:hypothetical protein